jgi:hypothetical protein
MRWFDFTDPIFAAGFSAFWYGVATMAALDAVIALLRRRRARIYRSTLTPDGRTMSREEIARRF